MASRRVIKTFSLFVLLTERFIAKYRDAGDQFVQYMLASSVIDELQIERELIARLTPLFREYFIECAAAGNQLVNAEVAVLVRKTDIPFKYTRDLLEQINEISVFKGYYNNRYVDGFARSEINRMYRYIRSEIDELKRIILTGAYQGTDELVLAQRILESDISKSINLTKNRARLLARNETQRLRETTKAIYFRQPEVNTQFDRVWYTRQDSAVRPSHNAMMGKKANKDGQFYSDDVGLVNGPGSGPTEFAVACRCYTDFVRKTSET